MINGCSTCQCRLFHRNSARSETLGKAYIGLFRLSQKGLLLQRRSAERATKEPLLGFRGDKSFQQADYPGLHLTTLILEQFNCEKRAFCVYRP